MKPFVLFEIEGGNHSDTTVVGATDVVPILVDWDNVEIDADAARECIEEIRACYLPGEDPEPSVQLVLGRLQEIVDEDKFDGFEDDEDE